jgi:HEAT repeat protein
MFDFSLQPFSFVAGFLAGYLFWYLLNQAKPLWAEMRSGMKENREAAKSRKSSSVEENHRRTTLRRAQGMHLAASLFALDEILLEPLLVSPPPPVEPGETPKFEDVVSQTVPYLPSWPEVAAVYVPQTLTLPQALAGDSNFIVIGPPGIGKTVALAHLATLSANRSEELGSLQSAVPFLVHVADLNLPAAESKDPLKPIIESASEHAPMLDVGRIPAFVQGAFRSGQALLLVDGYDEIPPGDQAIVVEFVKSILRAHPLTRVVISGTPEYLDGLIGLGFTPLSLMGWSPMRMDRFLQRWGELWSQTVALEAWNQTRTEQVDPVLLNFWLSADRLNLTPLELTLKTWAAYAGDCMGPSVLDGIASHIRRIAPANTPLAALETLAMQVILSSQPIFDPRKARDWVKSFEALEDKQDTLAIDQAPASAEGDSKPIKAKKGEKVVAAPTSGLLGRMTSSGLLSNSANSRMRFIHLVFAGYLAGRGMTNYAAEEVILNQPDWSGKYLAMRYFAGHGDASKLVQSLLEFSRMPMHRPLLGAARWLRDAPRNAPWRGRLFSTLASLFQTEGIPLSLRGQAMAAFAISNDPGAAALFRQFASTTAFELVQLSVLGSGILKDVKAIPVLEQVLNAPSLSVRRAACMALVAIGTTEALEVVAHSLLQGDEEVRRAAAEALANDTGEGHAMLRDGLTINDIMLRRSVAYGLGRVDDSWAVEALQKIQIEDDQWVVRNAATEVLDARTNYKFRAPHRLKAPAELPWLIEFAGKQGVGISPGAQATDILLLALKSDDPEARLAALPYLKYTPTEGVITQLYAAMYKDDPELREAAFNILWEIGTSGFKLPHPSQYGFG